MNRPHSPIRQRAERIQNQIHGLTLGHKDQSTRIEEADERVTLLEQGVKELRETLDLKIQHFKDGLEEVMALLKNTKQPVEQSDEAFKKDLQELDEGVQEKIQSIIQSRNEQEEQINTQIAESIGELKEQLVGESKERNEQIKSINQCLEVQIKINF